MLPNRAMHHIYEYKPNRADELHMYPNDKIKVFYENGRDWWRGQLEDGQQGYFSSSYVLSPGSSQLSDVINVVLVFLLLTLNIFHAFFYCFYC